MRRRRQLDHHQRPRPASSGHGLAVRLAACEGAPLGGDRSGKALKLHGGSLSFLQQVPRRFFPRAQLRQGVSIIKALKRVLRRAAVVGRASGLAHLDQAADLHARIARRRVSKSGRGHGNRAASGRLLDSMLLLVCRPIHLYLGSTCVEHQPAVSVRRAGARARSVPPRHRDGARRRVDGDGRRGHAGTDGDTPASSRIWAHSTSLREPIAQMCSADHPASVTPVTPDACGFFFSAFLAVRDALEPRR